MKHTAALMICLTLAIMACSQSQENRSRVSRKVGGPCEGCEAIYEYGDKKLTSVDTLPDFSKASQKLKITGIIYQKDGKTPAKNVILYAYHTNEKGIYPQRGNETGWGKRHGYLRGWIKTAADGKYTLYTRRPASYPNSDNPQHIHLTVKEPNKNEYYIDDFLFEDDPLVTAAVLQQQSQRGGSLVLTLQKKGDLWLANKNITLGLNIPDYD